MRVHAAIAEAARAPLSIEAVELAGLGPHDVLIEARAAGLCHSDLHVLQGGAPSYLFPTILGHEGAGVVLECGARVERLKPGDHVVTCAIGECGHCDNCRSDRTNLCETKGLPGLAVGMQLSPYFSRGGRPIATQTGGAAFATHTIIDQDFVTKVPSALPWDVACLFGCAVLTGVGAVLHTAKVRPGDTVAVFGLGGVGLNAVDAARMVGAEKIIGVDLNRAKGELARDFGLTDFIDAGEPDVVSRIQALTGGGVTHAFECTGSMSVAELALRSTRSDYGQLMVIGAAPAGRDRLALTLGEVQSGRSILGGLMGKAKPRTDLAAIIDRFMAGELRTDRLITHRLRQDQIGEGFRLMEAGESIRSVVLYS